MSEYGKSAAVGGTCISAIVLIILLIYYWNDIVSLLTGG